MNCEHYINFSKYFGAFYYTWKHNPEQMLDATNERDILNKHLKGNYPANIIKGKENFYEDIRQSLPRCKIFEVSNEIKKLLSMTDTPIKNDEIKLPYPFVFIDVAFTREELAELGIEMKPSKMVGIMVREGIMVNQATKEQVGKDLRISIMLEGVNAEDKEDCWFVTFNRNFNLEKEWEDLTVKQIKFAFSDEKSEDFAYKFFLNFLNFLYNPEIEVVEVSRTQKNMERRLKQGKPIIPSSYTIFLTGKLKEYIDRLQSGGQFHFNYRFWVRGHFRTLQAERWGEKRGTRIWICPFIKGDGILIDKSYQLKESKANNLADERGLSENGK